MPRSSTILLADKFASTAAALAVELINLWPKPPIPHTITSTFLDTALQTMEGTQQPDLIITTPYLDDKGENPEPGGMALAFAAAERGVPVVITLNDELASSPESPDLKEGNESVRIAQLYRNKIGSLPIQVCTPSTRIPTIADACYTHLGVRLALNRLTDRGLS